MLSKTTPRICASILNLTSTPNFSSQCLRFLITTTTTTTPQFSTTTITQRPSQRSHAFRSSSTSSSPTYQSSLRSISTSTPPTTTTTTTTSPLPPSSSSSLTDQQPLTWDAYLRLRRKRRHYNLLASLLTSMNTTAAGVTFLGSQNFELMNIFGLDPFLALGAFTVVSGGVGWLLGPFVGNIIFGVVYRRIRGAIAAVSPIPPISPLPSPLPSSTFPTLSSHPANPS